MSWYRVIEGQEVGPFSSADMRDAVRKGLITPDTMVRRDGMSVAVRAADVRGLLDSDSTPAPAEGSNAESSQVLSADASANRQVRQYKVLTQKDKWFTSKFDPERLEVALNAYAEQGWAVKAVATATFPGWLRENREELVVILER